MIFFSDVENLDLRSMLLSYVNKQKLEKFIKDFLCMEISLILEMMKLKLVDTYRYYYIIEIIQIIKRKVNICDDDSHEKINNNNQLL